MKYLLSLILSALLLNSALAQCQLDEINKGLPSCQLNDLQSFLIPITVIKNGANSEAINAYSNFLRTHEWDMAGREDAYHYELELCRQAENAWDMLNSAANPQYGPGWRCLKLKQLRNLIGLDNYEAGIMPPFPQGAIAFIKH